MISDAQRTAFVQGSGGIAAIEVATVIALSVAVFYTLWLTWLALAQHRAWWQGDAEIYDLAWTVLRAAVLVLLVSYWLQP